MNRSAFLIVSGSALLLGCGGKSAGAKSPTTSSDLVCAAGVHASGVTGKAATWDAVVVASGSTADDVCNHSPCGPDEPYSFVGETAVAVKVNGGYTVIGDVTDGFGGATAKLTELGDLRLLSVESDILGRDEVTLDDGEETTATVLLGRSHYDYVLDPASGKVLWRGSCTSGEDQSDHATVVTRNGAIFSYDGCIGKGPAVTFTAEQAAACPSE